MTYEQYTNGGGGSGRRSSQEIQSDLQSIRGEIQQTLHALSNQLQPGQLLHQAWSSLRGGTGGGRFFRNLSRAVEENPLPVVMIGAGFSYLLYSDARRGRSGYEYEVLESGEAEGRIEGKVHEGVDRARGKAQRGAGKLRELSASAKGGAHKLREGATGLSGNVRGKLHATRGRMQELGSQTQQEWHHMNDRAREVGGRGRELVHEQPLILAGLGVAIGAALAALAPMSRKEHEVFGETGHQLKEQARHAAHEATEKAKAAGSGALETFKSEATGEGASDSFEGNSPRGEGI